MNLTTLMDTPRLYTALAEWGACLVYIFLLRRKMSGLKLSFLLGGSLIVLLPIMNLQELFRSTSGFPV